MQTKICTKCNKELPATNEYFYKAKGGKYGLQGRCINCENEYKRYMYKLTKYKVLERVQEYRINNKEQIKITSNRSKSNKLGLLSTLTLEQWNLCKKYFNDSCAYCGKSEEEEIRENNRYLEQEHFIAQSKGGEYTIHNIIPACKNCNARKFNNDFFEWYPKQTFYTKKREKNILKYLKLMKVNQNNKKEGI